MKTYTDESQINFTDFHDGVFSDREIYISKKADDKVSIALEDGESYSYIEMTTQEFKSLISQARKFINN